MSQDKGLMSNGRRLPPNNGTRSIASAAGEPDPQKDEFLKRLRELRVWLDRKYATFPRPCADRTAVEELTRIVNMIAQAERAGRSNAAQVWPRNTAAQTDSLGIEDWKG